MSKCINLCKVNNNCAKWRKCKHTCDILFLHNISLNASSSVSLLIYCVTFCILVVYLYVMIKKSFSSIFFTLRSSVVLRILCNLHKRVAYSLSEILKINPQFIYLKCYYLCFAVFSCQEVSEQAGKKNLDNVTEKLTSIFGALVCGYIKRGLYHCSTRGETRSSYRMLK